MDGVVKRTLQKQITIFACIAFVAAAAFFNEQAWADELPSLRSADSFDLADSTKAGVLESELCEVDSSLEAQGLLTGREVETEVSLRSTSNEASAAEAVVGQTQEFSAYEYIAIESDRADQRSVREGQRLLHRL